jgi:hypothetical protein
MIRQRDEGARFREPFIANRVPLLRDRRKDPGRQWLVPYIDVVIDSRGFPYEDTRPTVDGVLASSLPDLRVSLIGPWSSLTDERRPLLDDPLLDYQLLRWRYGHDGRVRLVESVPETAAPALVSAADVPPPTWPNDWKGEAERWRAEAEKWKEAATLKKRLRTAPQKQPSARDPSPALRGARHVRRLARLVARPK